jgi:immunity protein 70 of polymorphic toxin system
MEVGFQVGRVFDVIGTPDFLHAFFSTISFHLEPEGWGTRYPELMRQLYRGTLDVQHAAKVLQDVLEIREQLRSFPPSAVIWDIEDLDARPPWGDEISDDITDLSNYFVTSTGRDVFKVLIDCLEGLIELGGSMTIATISGEEKPNTLVFRLLFANQGDDDASSDGDDDQTDGTDVDGRSSDSQ